AKCVIVLVRERRRGFGYRAPGPPSTERARDAADQRTDRSRRGANARANEHTGDPAGCFAQLVAETRVRIVAAEGTVFRPLETTVDRIAVTLVLHRTAFAKESQTVEGARTRPVPAQDLTPPTRPRRFHVMPAKIHIGTQGWNYDAWVG